MSKKNGDGKMTHTENRESSGCTGCFVVALGVLAGIAMVPIAPFVIAYLALKDDKPEWDYDGDDAPHDSPYPR